MRLPLLLVPLLLLAGCAGVPPAPKWRATDPGEFEQPLTLADCLRLARANDVRAAEWRARIEAVHADLAAARAVPNPVLHLSWDGLGLHDEADRSLATMTAGVSYPLLFFWLRPRQIAVAKAKELAEAEALRAERRQLTVEVGASFYSLLAGQRRVDVARELLEVARESLRLAEAGKRLGVRSGYEVERAGTEMLQAEADLASAETRLRQDRVAFAFALGADRPATPVVTAPADLETAPEAARGREGLPDALIEEVLARDPSFARARAASAVAEQSFLLETRSAIPLADLSGSAARKIDPSADSTEAGLEVPVPIYDQNLGGKTKAEAALAAARAEEEKARRSAIAGLAREWERIRGAVDHWRRFAQPLARRVEQSAAAAGRLFAAGSVDYGEMLQAQRDLGAARREEVEAWYEAMNASWALGCALGRNDPEGDGS